MMKLSEEAERQLLNLIGGMRLKFDTINSKAITLGSRDIQYEAEIGIGLADEAKSILRGTKVG